MTAYAIERDETLPFICREEATSFRIAFFDFMTLRDRGAGSSFSTSESESLMLPSLADVGDVKICL
jgi:hypothetical protein